MLKQAKIAVLEKLAEDNHFKKPSYVQRMIKGEDAYPIMSITTDSPEGTKYYKKNPEELKRARSAVFQMLSKHMGLDKVQPGRGADDIYRAIDIPYRMISSHLTAANDLRNLATREKGKRQGTIAGAGTMMGAGLGALLAASKGKSRLAGAGLGALAGGLAGGAGAVLAGPKIADRIYDKAGLKRRYLHIDHSDKDKRLSMVHGSFDK